MKQAFEILKGRPRVSLVLTRDSVCAGDDCEAPHEKKIEAYSLLAPDAFAREVSSGYLPSVAGSGHSWICVLNGRKIAEVTVSDVKSLVSETPFADENRVHFTYKSATY